LKHFILNSEPGINDNIRLEGNDYHYLVRVRRLAAGDSFPALLPNGEETLVKIISADRNTLIGKCNTQKCVNSFDKIPPIILFQAIPKGDKMDLIVRQAAESGITEIVPFMSEFSVGKAAAGGQKFSRWEKIIKEARQQSGSKIATKINPLLSIKELLEYWHKLKKEDVLGLIFLEKGLENQSLHGYLINNPKIVIMVIGSEGGFSEKEVSIFLDNGFMPLTIGDTILRTETAALYFAAAVRILLLERDSWELKRNPVKQTKTDSE